MFTNAEMLKALRRMDQEVLTSRERWTTMWYARDEHGFRLSAPSAAGGDVVCMAARAHNARCWCLLGAFAKATPTLYYMRPEDRKALERALGVESVAKFNDEGRRTFGEVKDLLADAIARLGTLPPEGVI